MPSFAGTPGTFLANLNRLNDDVWSVDVVDEHGQQATSAAVDLEEGGLIEQLEVLRRASIVALGRSVASFADLEAFHASDESLLDPSGTPSEPPQHFVDQGWPWPPRMGQESFISYGVFSSGSEAKPLARLHGTVLTSERRTTVETGQQFIVTRVRTVGMDVDMCLPGADYAELPQPGHLIGGEVYLVASFGDLPADATLLGRLRSRFA